MVQFTATIKRFDKQGEKTGWTYIEITPAIAQQLKESNKQTFRVKGLLDSYTIKGVALMPMGGGAFVLPLNAAMRKGIGKNKGATLSVQLEVDPEGLTPPAELMECLVDETAALAHFKQLPKSHLHYFIRWIGDAKTDGTKARRIAQSINALAKGLDFGAMLRAIKEEKAIR